MRRFVACQTLRLVVGIVGAVVVAAAIAAVGEPISHNFPGFLQALCRQLLQYARADLGVSAISGVPVAHELTEHLPPTLALMAMGTVLALCLGVPFGLLLSLGPARRIAAPLVQIVTATPVFCSGLALAFLAVHGLQWPVSINAPVGADVPPDQFLPITVLPVLTVGLAGAAAIQLALRRATARSNNETFRIGLKRMGLGLSEIETRYVLPQIVAGLLRNAGEIMLALLSATVVAEWVFHRDGAADLFVRSVALADWNMTANLLFVFALTTFIADYLGRILAATLSPGDRT